MVGRVVTGAEGFVVTEGLAWPAGVMLGVADGVGAGVQHPESKTPATQTVQIDRTVMPPLR